MFKCDTGISLRAKAVEIRDRLGRRREERRKILETEQTQDTINKNM